MLINAIILFLRDALPVFLLMSLLLAQGNVRQLGHRWLWGGILFGLALATLLSVCFDPLSRTMQGAGIEWFTFWVHGLIYVLVVIHLFLFSQKRPMADYWQFSAMALSVLTISINGSYLLVFLNTYWHAAAQYGSLLIGTILGFGVCLSVGILIYLFNYRLLRSGQTWPFVLMLLCWSAGQLVLTFNLLAQVNVISTTTPVWNTGHWIADSSEVGLVLNTLMGYEATPTLMQIIVYLLCTLLPVVVLSVTGHHKGGPTHRTGVSE